MKIPLCSRRFFIKMFTITLSLLLMLCIIFSLLIYVQEKKFNNKAIFKSETERNTNLLKQSEFIFRQLSAIGGSILNSSLPDSVLDISNEYKSRIILDQMIDSHISANPYIRNIDVIVKGLSTSATKTYHEKDLGQFQFFQMFTGENLTWPYNFDLVSAVKNSSKKVTLTISGYYLSKQLFLSESNDHLDYLLTSEGIVLLSNQRSSFFENIDSLYPGILQNLSSIPTNYLFTYENYYFVLSEPNQYNLQILSLIPKPFYDNQYIAMQLRTILMVCVLSIVSVFISIFLSYRFYYPIKTMVNLFQSYTHNDLNQYRNEITFIQQSLSKFINDKVEIQDKLSRTLEELQNNQTVILQNQINAHFLFNTMENIKAISITELGIDNEVENAIILLNSIVREGVFQKTIFVTLAHEIYLTRCYLELMQLRFPEVQANWSVDETLQEYMVLKFSLQPVLENCFSHAFKGYIERQAQIHISVCREHEGLVIRIQDNGHGMDANSMKRIQQQLISSDTLDDSPSSSLHVGICNVNKRIINAFGVHYGITIMSTPPGVTVEIRHPLLLTQKDHA